MKFLVLIEKHQNAIIGTLIIHVLIFVWLNIQNISFYVIQPKEKILATLDFTEHTSPIESSNKEKKKNILISLKKPMLLQTLIRIKKYLHLKKKFSQKKL